MNPFGRMFGRRTEPIKTPPVYNRPPEKPPTAKQDLIRVYDAYGRELLITRDQWRQKVLPGTLEKAWGIPDQLYNLIVTAMTDGFRTDVLGAAQHLYRTDPNRVRAACLWGVLLMEEGRLQEAEQVFRDSIINDGESGYVLANLAKVYSRRGEAAKSEETLWHSLEVDPNQENAVAWYRAIHRERGGSDADQQALKRLADLPGSWRAQLWLARAALESGQTEAAVSFYHEVIERAGTPTPEHALMQMSGDLGNHGKLSSILDLVEPRFDCQVHGIQVGNNLIKANLDLGRIDAASELVNRLYGMQRPDWKKTLSFWDTEIAKARIALNATPAPLQMSMLTVDGPVWLPDSSPAMRLFPTKNLEGARIGFLGSSAQVPNATTEVSRQLADDPGRLSRGLPLFLAEQVYFRSNSNSLVLIPWIDAGGFVLSGRAWSDAEAADCASKSTPYCDYIAVSHLIADTDPWAVQMRIVKTKDANCVFTLEASFKFAQFQDNLPQLASQLLEMLFKHTQIKMNAPPALYQVPGPTQFQSFLLRLEQLLAVRCGSMAKPNAKFLNGERNIMDANIQLCVACPDNVTTRLLLAKTVDSMKKARPDVVPEFSKTIQLLQKEKALPEPAQAVVNQILGG